MRTILQISRVALRAVAWAAKLSFSLFLYVALCTTAQANGVVWTHNLLSNPGAEAGTLASWVTDDPVIVQASQMQSSSSGTVTPNSGSWFFNMGSAPAAASGVSITKNLYQEVDVSAYGVAIDNSQIVVVAGTYFQTEDRPRLEGSDFAKLNVSFMDGSGGTIDRWNATLQSPNLAWVQGRLKGLVPSGTRRIGFELQGEKFETTFVNAFFDDTELRLGLSVSKVEIDIVPSNNENKQNKINPSSRRHIWIAILSDTNTLFDALQVDISTVRFGPDEAQATRHKVRDINRDGLPDLLLRFKIRDTGIACGDTEASLMGETYDGQQFSGDDSVKTVGCK